MTLLADLLAARARIDRPEKWCKGTLQKGDRYCAIGALLESRGVYALLTAVPHNWSVSSYNDHPDTTHADIMALYDRAIGNERYRNCLRGLA